MKRFIAALLTVLLALTCASAEEAALTLGDFTLMADPAWRIEVPDTYQLYIYDASGKIVCNLQFYDYASLSQSHDELLASGLNDDYGIAEMIISSVAASGGILGDMEKEYAEYGSGISAVHYYGDLAQGAGNGCYSGTIMVNSDVILSAMTISYVGSMDAMDVRSFHNSILARLQLDGTAVTAQQSSDGALPGIQGADPDDYAADQPGQGYAQTAELSCISFVTPDGWQLVSSGGTQAIYSCGDASICLNAYAPGTLYPDMNKMDAEKLTECLIYIVDAAMEATGIDTGAFEYMPFNLSNGDTAVFFEGEAGAAMQDQYLTSAMFLTPGGVTGLVTILTPENDRETNAALLAQSVNMYYTTDVLAAADIPQPSAYDTNVLSALAGLTSLASNSTPASETVQNVADAAPVITGIDGPVAAVISTSGISLNADESAALTAAIAYTAAGEYTYEALIDTLMADGFSREAAVFAADNCGADWTD